MGEATGATPGTGAAGAVAPESGAGGPAAPDAADPLAAELCRELGDAFAGPVGGPDGGAAATLTIPVRREEIARVMAVLRSRFRYTLLVDLCATDDPARVPRFEVIYHLYSFRENRRLRLRVRTGEDEAVPSVSATWRGAAWAEREVFDLFGVPFSGHPELSRLLLWEGFAGHPLRKDFPLGGRDTGAARELPAAASPR
jgi:NADH-quinone oxidoreductase subunit C